MALAFDHFAVNGDVYDVLEDCDQLSLGLGRLRRQGRLSEPDWVSVTEHLAGLRARIEAQLTGGRSERKETNPHESTFIQEESR